MKYIINATMGKATREQINQGVVTSTPAAVAAIRKLLTFTTPPSSEEIRQRATAISDWVSEEVANLPSFVTVEQCQVMIGGAPYLMGPLTAVLKEWIQPVFSFTALMPVIEGTGEPFGAKNFPTPVHIGWVEAV